MIATILWRTLQRLVILIGLFAIVSASAVRAEDGPPITWHIEIKTAFTRAQTRSPVWEQDIRMRETALAARLQTHGTRLETIRLPQAEGVEIVWRAQGAGTWTLFQRVAFDDLSIVGGVIGGPAILTLQGSIQHSESISLALESNPSTGYAWTVNAASGVRASDTIQFRQKAGMPGAPAIQTVTLNATRDGDASLVLAYRRAWETFEPTRAITVTAARLAALTPIVNPIAPAVTPPPNLPVRVPESVNNLPSTFNWATSDNYLGAPKLTPIRNQGGCGSCWAFSTVAAFEGNIYIKDNVSRDLSEQFLVSCNRDGWGCNGGWWGHKYHYDTTIPNDPNPGAVYESTFPYVGYGASCNAPYTRPYRLNNWFYISGAWSIPSVEAIKNAIYQYGPVSVAVCAGPVFQNYRSGIYSTNESSYCGSDQINHAVNLVGWNDAENTWILRNSWGTGWGENGYMRITRGVSNIGLGASYVVYNGTTTCYTLTTNVNPAGGGTISVNPSPNCGSQYTAGTTVTLTANPSAGRTFLNWSGDASGSANPTTVIMNANKNVTANFSSGVTTFKTFLPLLIKSSETNSWSTILSDDFEGAFPGAWTLAYNTSKNSGYLWGKRSCRPYAGGYSAWAVGSGTLGASLGCGTSYPNNVQTWMKYGPFNLTNTSAAELRARLWTHTESPSYAWDVVFIGASVNGTNFYGTMYYGDWNWEEQVLDFKNVYTLGNLLGQSSVWIAFVFDTNSSVAYTEGGYVDNVLLRKCPSGATCSTGITAPPAGANQFALPAAMTLRP
ncbi:MAG: protease inhibitor I42 family protein [Anaerolineae bacterium]|nr:protease inhibitor I42 family protein [Anaerolineae bacterium]